MLDNGRIHASNLFKFAFDDVIKKFATNHAFLFSYSPKRHLEFTKLIEIVKMKGNEIFEMSKPNRFQCSALPNK
jgi:hypothetical protein